MSSCMISWPPFVNYPGACCASRLRIGAGVYYFSTNFTSSITLVFNLSYKAYNLASLLLFLRHCLLTPHMTMSSSWPSSTSSTTVNTSARNSELSSSPASAAAKSQMIIESVLYPPSHGYGLFITAKRYYLPSFKENWGDPEALTLIFLHATSLHKEIWEPTIESVFRVAEEAQRRKKTGKGSSGKGKDEEYVPKICEAWAIDCPNHGESGRWNEGILLEPQWYLNCASIQCSLLDF
jgi:hypothetical protein